MGPASENKSTCFNQVEKLQGFGFCKRQNVSMEMHYKIEFLLEALKPQFLLGALKPQFEADWKINLLCQKVRDDHLMALGRNFTAMSFVFHGGVYILQ